MSKKRKIENQEAGRSLLEENVEKVIESEEEWSPIEDSGPALSSPENIQPTQQTEDNGDNESGDSAVDEQADEADLEDSESASDDEDDGADHPAGSTTPGPRKRRKIHDSEVFATSISKILGSKLSISKRHDPVLSRSVSAAKSSEQIADLRLESKARGQLREERRMALQKGRVRDVLGVDNTTQDTSDILIKEKRLKKVAQRGVIKLFNAVREAQIKAEEAADEVKRSGVVGIGQREKKIAEMSKMGFLDLIAAGGKKSMASLEA